MPKIDWRGDAEGDDDQPGRPAPRRRPERRRRGPRPSDEALWLPRDDVPPRGDRRPLHLIWGVPRPEAREPPG